MENASYYVHGEDSALNTPWGEAVVERDILFQDDTSET